MKLCHRRTALAAVFSLLLVPGSLVAIGEHSWAATASGKTAVRTQLQPRAHVSGVAPILWIPAKTTLTLQCLAVGEKAYGAVAKADPYYFRTSYGGKTGYAIDADLYTAKDATKLGLTYCSIPSQTSNPTAKSITHKSVVLAWADKSNNETSFKTQYSTDGGKTWRAGPSASANATSVNVTGLAASKKYTFQVGAANNKGTKWSAYVTATTAKVPVATSANGACNYRLSGGTAGDYVKDAGKGQTVGTYTIQGKQIAVCGPTPGYTHLQNAANKYGVSPYNDSVRYGSNKYKDPAGKVFDGLDGYQCTELTMRWLFVRDGVRYGASAWGDGRVFVSTAARLFSNKYRAIANGSKDKPRAGDVISFNSVSGNPAGHVAVVKSDASLNNRGDGTVVIIEQNIPRQRTLKVSGWKIAAQGGAGSAVNWLRKR